MTRVAPWLALAAVLASFCFGITLARGQHFSGPAGAPGWMQPPPSAPIGGMMMPGAYPGAPPHAMMQMPAGPMQMPAGPTNVMPIAYQTPAMPQGPAAGMMPAYDPQLMPVGHPAYPQHPHLQHAPPLKGGPAQKACGGCGKSRQCGKVCDCGCDVTWRVRASWLSLARDLGQSPLVFANNETRVGADQFDSDYQSGFEITTLHRLYDYPNLIVQLGYFQVDDIDDRLNYTSQANDMFGYLIGAPGIAREIHYSSSLRSAEGNLVAIGPLGLVDWIFGFRYIQLNEDSFDLLTTTTPPTIGLRSQTENDLYGLQFGGDILLLDTQRLRVNALIKGASFFARTTSNWFDVLNHSDGTTDGEDEIAYMAEVRLSAAYRLLQHVDVECGYRGIWLDKVALAGEQWTSTNATRTTTVTGDVLFHGFDVGIVGRW